MTSTLSAKEQSISKIFSDDYVFTIPDYQRPYSWRNEQARELIEDLLDYMQAAGGKPSEIAPYFLGSIVLIKNEAESETTVVDGQQRLTTLTLLLSAIRANVADQEVRDSITKCIYEQGSVVFGTEARYRLTLRDLDRDFFRQYVQHADGIEKLVGLNDSLPDAQRRLRENARLYMEMLATLDQVTVMRLVQFIVTRCYLVTVITPDFNSAYRIFGVLNSRGLDLSATDILKAEIISAIDPVKRSVYTRKWEDLEEGLGRDAFGDLFSHIRMVYRKSKPKSTLLNEFREHVGPGDSAAFIDDVLAPMAQAFREIIGADFSSQKHSEEVNTTLSWLNRIEFKDWLPPALAFFSRQRNDPAAMLRFFRDLERLAYSMLVRRSGVNERIERFSRLTTAIEGDDDLYVAGAALQLTPKEQYDTYQALSGALYYTHSARALSVILLRLDALLSGGGATYEHDIVTVEHVLPQNPKPDSAWMEWLPDTQDRLDWVHRLGNLALLTRRKNSAASNFDFDYKKSVYFIKDGVCPFVLTTQVLQHAQWKLGVLEARQTQLMHVLEKHWRLEERKGPQEVAIELANAHAGGQWPVFEMESAKHNLIATAQQASGQFIVLAGSKAKSEWTGFSHSYQALRADLLKSGQLKPSEDGSLVFSRNTPFNSPSAASAVILGRPDNGRTTWIETATGRTYAEWEDSLLIDEEDDSEDVKHGDPEIASLFRRFWEQFIERAKARTDLFNGRTTSSSRRLGAGIGRAGFRVHVSLMADHARVACFMRLPGKGGALRTAKAFAALRARRTAIEQRFGAALEWDEMPGSSGSRIKIEIPGGWRLPEAQWPVFQDELASLADRLALAVTEPIHELEI